MLLEARGIMPLPTHIHIIINPAAGSPEPILTYLNQLLGPTGIDWKVTVTRQPGEVYSTARQLVEQASPDVLAIYGGDGSVMEAASALHGSAVPLAILPGGTANVMAKELGISVDTKEAIKMLLCSEANIKKIDMGLVNGVPFLIRVNLGILADMITETSDEMKDKWGQWAYGITAFQTMNHEPTTYQLTIDGKEYVQEAVALTVTNAGNVGRKGYDFLPGISVTDGLLDVIALDRADMLSLLKVTGSMLLQKDSAVLKHWMAKEVIIRTGANLPFLRDDVAQTAPALHFTISPASLHVVIPANSKHEKEN
jgi:diacylglycerol kinase (ATP)